MRRNLFAQNFKVLAVALLLCAVCPFAVRAQDGDGQPGRQPAETIAPAARASEVACGGFITLTPTESGLEIVGGQEEQAQRFYSEGDYVFISGSVQEGLKVGQEFAVLRPRGQFKSKFSRKKGSLGVYTQEVGRVRVVRVRNGSSVALVLNSCDNLLHGDLLHTPRGVPAPAGRAEGVLDPFAEPTGKQTGRIVLARDTREALSLDQVVFIDLGAEDNVKPGDYLTVFRPNHKGVIVDYGDEITRNARDGYESDEFRGGKFSIQSQRLKRVNDNVKGETVTSPKIFKRRPPVPRKVVGEIVILRVEARTATAVITRTVQEIHTGDHVEVQ